MKLIIPRLCIALSVSLGFTSFDCNAQTDSKNRPDIKLENKAPTIAPGTLSLIAGSTEGPGWADGVGLQAQFSRSTLNDFGVNSKGLVIDSSGNLYIADTGNHIIRKMTPQGVVTTIAGKAGQAGSTDGMNSTARFKFPSGLAIDAKNNLYVADVANSTIRKISPEGQVSTVAGSPGQFAWADGQGASARFNRPMGITANAAGELFVTDMINYCIRKISPNGVVSTIAGQPGKQGLRDGTGTQAQFGVAKDIAVDADGVLYVADESNNAIRKISNNGVVSTLSLIVEPARFNEDEVASLKEPDGLAIDSAGNLYVTQGAIIRVIDKNGKASVIAGHHKAGHLDGRGSDAIFRAMGKPALDAAGNIYVADDNFIRRINKQGDVSTIAGQKLTGGYVDGPGADARFDLPFALVADKQGNLYVSDHGNNVIRKISPIGVVSTVAGMPGPSGQGHQDGEARSAKFKGVSNLALDDRGSLYVVEIDNRDIRKLDSKGKVSTVVSAPKEDFFIDGVQQVDNNFSPDRIAINSAGKIFFSSRDVLYQLNAKGQATVFAGNRAYRRKDGIGEDAVFLSMTNIAFDYKGNMVVFDDQVLRKISPTANVTSWGEYGEEFIVQKDYKFLYYPKDIVIDKNDDIYFTFDSTIRKRTASDTVTTLAGIAHAHGTQLGLIGSLYDPSSLVRLGPKTFAVISGNAVLKLQLP
ncbi:hypothetical protein [Undibacterium sp. TJN19]|uniref:hypothetical protein n=1 Tax=Undibacterium sp. TJN19 TaxID=3413055 RepID=UPI003BF45A6C